MLLYLMLTRSFLCHENRKKLRMLKSSEVLCLAFHSSHQKHHIIGGDEADTKLEDTWKY